MEHRQLGGTGLQISVAGLGSNTFGRFCDEERSIAIVRRALDLGISHIDTADSYSAGISEQYIGKAIVGHRHQVVLASKTGDPMHSGPNGDGLSYRRVIASCEASLRRLGTDYIDLYYLHTPDARTPLAESLRAYDDLVRQGKVRYVGISNHQAWQVCEALWICDRRGYQPPVVSQNRYSLFQRTVELELLPFSRAHRVGIIPAAPLAGGLLTGKYKKGVPAQPGQRGYNNPVFDRLVSDGNFEIIDRLATFASATGHNSGELAVAWLLAHPEVPSVIAGVTSVEQLEANVKAAEWKLTAEDLQAIEKICAVS